MRCNYCRKSIVGNTFWYNTKPYCSRTCRELSALKVVRGAGFQSWLLIGAAALAIAMLSFAWTPKARAHDPSTHQPDELSDAYSEAYGRCCQGDDYHKLRIEEWEPTENGWRIKWHGQWLDVKRNAKVRNVPNPDGEAKAWVFGEPNNTYVRCFMEGTLG